MHSVGREGGFALQGENVPRGKEGLGGVRVFERGLWVCLVCGVCENKDGFGEMEWSEA